MTDSSREDEEYPHQQWNRAAHPAFQLPFCLEVQEVRTMQREHRNRRHAHKQRVWVQQIDERLIDGAVLLQVDAGNDVSERYAQKEREAQRGDGENPIPYLPPALGGPLAAKLDRHCPQDHHEQHQDERQIEAREERGVDRRERSE